MSPGDPFTIADGGVTLTIRVTPNASANRIEHAEIRDDGSAVLRVRVTAPPDKGRANKAVIALIAKALPLPNSAIAITAGETARQKTLLLRGDPARIATALQALLSTT